MIQLLIAMMAAAQSPYIEPRANDADKRPAKACSVEKPQLADRQKQPTRPRKLGELPPGEQYYAVLRHIDGCMVPVKVREYR